MRFLIDGIFMTPDMKGVGWYTHHILLHLARMAPEDEFVVSIILGRSSAHLPKADNISYRGIKWKNHFWHGLIGLPELSRKVRPDVVFVPYESPFGRIKVPYALLCHDVPGEIWKSQDKVTGRRGPSLKNMADNYLIRRAINKAELVFCNSEYVAGWVRKITRKSPECLRVAPCAPAIETISSFEMRDKIEIPEGYVLVFYTGDPRENLPAVLKVYDMLIQMGIRECLVIGGLKDSARKELNRSLEKYGWKYRIVTYDFIPSERAGELASLYRNASLYLDLSLHEGFGMQVIEAMMYETPVVCSERGALPEVAADGAVLVDPESPDAVAKEVSRLLSDTSARDELVLRGVNRAKMFNWERTAGIILDGLRRLYSDGRCG